MARFGGHHVLVLLLDATMAIVVAAVMLWVAALSSVCVCLFFFFSMLLCVFVALLFFPLCLLFRVTPHLAFHNISTFPPTRSTHRIAAHVVSEISGDLEQWCLVLCTLGS